MEQSTQYFSDIEKDMRGPESRLASGGKRFANLLIDIITFYAMAALYGVVAGLFLGGFSESSSEETSLNLIFIAVYLVYFTALEFTTGKTLGKMITKTHVVKEDGEKIDLKTAIIRSLCRLIPFEAFSFLGGKAIGWHDSISKTRVINDEE